MSSTALNQPLPPDAIVGATWGPFSYRKYPVFSFSWLKGRILLFGAFFTVYGVLAGLAQVAAKATWDRALISSAAMAGGFVLMALIGPGIATWVRHQRWSPRAEKWGLIAAVVVGLIAAPMVDFWASGTIRRALKPKEVPAKERKLGDVEKAQLEFGSMFGWLLYFGLSGGMSLFAYFSERRRLNARSAALSRLDANMRLAVLQAQVEPHFLFNTLAAIRPLIRQDAHQAEAALDALTDHLRATIPLMRETLQGSTSTLGQQLDICRSYLAVMQVRMGDRLRAEINVSDALRAGDFPPMLLLSLVENAIKHGIEPKPGPGCIRIEAKADGRTLAISVIDDGIGLQPGLSGGIGLANIREQLAVRFGDAASLTVAARPEGGTVATITIPTTA
jgi:hypothetical protein